MDHPFSLPAGTTWSDLESPAVVSLLVANLVPLFGALFLGWSGGVVVALYWYETAVIGFYSILKLPFALKWFAAFAVPFFMIHFGIFLWLSGGFALGLYNMLDDPGGEGLEILWPIQGEIQTFTAVAFVSHGISFLTNFIDRKEYRLTNDVNELMIAPYMRVFVMIGTVFAGVIVLAVTEAPAAFMGVFIVLKIVVHVIAHLREHALSRQHAQG